MHTLLHHSLCALLDLDNLRETILEEHNGPIFKCLFEDNFLEDAKDFINDHADTAIPAAAALMPQFAVALNVIVPFVKAQWSHLQVPTYSDVCFWLLPPFAMYQRELC
jgi:hypothetical protein